MNLLCNEWMNAREAENKAKAIRLDVEERMLAQLVVPEEGSKTINTDAFKIVATQKMSRSLDEDVYKLISIPDKFNPISFVSKPKIDDSGCRWLKANKPEIWQELSKALTEKPLKTNIRIEVLNV